MDFALFLAAFDETGFLTGGFRQASAQCVCQRGRPDPRVGVRAKHRPLPQAAATLTRTLPDKHKHGNDHI